MAIANAIKEAQSKGSWIRKMFEEGDSLKAKYGADRVYDFSIGNPDIEPPPAFHAALLRMASEDRRGSHGYMANIGYPDVREALARKVSREQQVSIDGSHLVMSVGAAGGLNCVFKAILNPGDEVIVSRPYFVEYGSYIANHGGKMVLVDATYDFDLDIDAIGRALNKRTAAVLINSPHNPTGKIYGKETIERLAGILRAHGKATGRYPYLIADEPYREIVYNGILVPPVLPAYEESIVVTSYSKSLSLPGERIGFVAVGPAVCDAPALVGALAYATRVLGYVNAPALMQRLVAELTEERVDVEIYARRRNVFVSVLREAGIEYIEPEGAFYLFCKVPGENTDDVAFVMKLKEHRILAVPGSGFGGPGYVRLAYCVDESIIEASRESFIRAVTEWTSSR